MEDRRNGTKRSAAAAIGGEDCGDSELWKGFDHSFQQVQTVLDRNRSLIQQVNENHQSRLPDNMAKNVALIQELNGNISKVVSPRLSAFKNRYQEVLAKAHTAAFAAASKFLNLSTKEETNLYKAAQSSMAAFKKWRIGSPRFQRAAVLGRKRKPID